MCLPPTQYVCMHACCILSIVPTLPHSQLLVQLATFTETDSFLHLTQASVWLPESSPGPASPAFQGWHPPRPTWKPQHHARRRCLPLTYVCSSLSPPSRPSTASGLVQIFLPCPSTPGCTQLLHSTHFVHATHCLPACLPPQTDRPISAPSAVDCCLRHNTGSQFPPARSLPPELRIRCSLLTNPPVSQQPKPFPTQSFLGRLSIL